MGASKPEEFGLYYAWGDVIGHQNDESYSFSQENYDNSEAKAIQSNLTSNNDAATVALGNECQMPTAEDLNELLNNCNNILTTLNGVIGRLFTSQLNGQVLFLPLAGFFSGLNNSSVGRQAHYWASTYQSTSSAISFYFDRNTIDGNASGSRRYGFNIRPVKKRDTSLNIVNPSQDNELMSENTQTVEEPKDNNDR